MNNNIEEERNRYNQIYCKYNKLYHDIAIKAELTDTTLWIFYAIYKSKNPLNQNDIACYLGMPKQTINSAVKQLEAQGYLTLVKKEGVKNCKNIELTEMGKNKCEATVAHLINAERHSFTKLTNEERKMFVDMYEKRFKIFSEEINLFLNN